MNAYELADGLSKMYIETDNHGLFNKRIQNMLRQQADRIAELEKELETLKIWTGTIQPIKTKQCKDCDEINPAEIHTCSPQTKAEPVAWIKTDDLKDLGNYPKNDAIWVWVNPDKKIKQSMIPLYTTPHHASDVKQTKSLSDEELFEILKSLPYSDAVRLPEGFRLFARAIEERHGIK